MSIRSESSPAFAATRLIKDQALRIGFDKVGIAPAVELDNEGVRLKEWLDSGFHASMKWMAREPEKRTDPRLLFPEAHSVVVVALNYFTPEQHLDDPETGKISRYAWGDDYHTVMTEKLRSLLAWVKEQWPEAEGKICVDIQPMMDKAWAVRAGLGWIGKHSNLITTELGSWVFIGELLLNLELEYDAVPVPDHCGTCTLCLDACPTNAIVEPYVVDSNLCISHATIELRDPTLPEPVAANLEGWLYGCDICQDVCPWNRFEQPSEVSAFSPRAGNISPKLRDIASLTHDQYVMQFKNSAIKRTKLSGLQRNAAALISRHSAGVAND